MGQTDMLLTKEFWQQYHSMGLSILPMEYRNLKETNQEFFSFSQYQLAEFNEEVQHMRVKTSKGVLSNASRI